MRIEYCYLLNIIMISRFVYLFSDTKLLRRDWIAMGVILLFGILPFEFNWMFLSLVIVLIIDLIILNILESRKMQLDVLRTANMFLLALLLTFLFQQKQTIQFNNHIYVILNGIDQISLFSFSIPAEKFLTWNIVLFGALLVTNEANLILRSIFFLLGITVEKKKTEKDLNLITVKENDFRSGRIIGILERLLMYYFILVNSFGSIAFIIAAKGFARFKELDDRLFAEYVLIGTLLSTLLSVIISGLIKVLL